MKKFPVLVALWFVAYATATAQKVPVKYIDEFENINHPQIAYWFIAPNMLPQAVYRRKIDSFVAYSKYTLVFLTARTGCDFSDVKTMHPIFRDMVSYAHKKGLKIGIQLFKSEKGTLPENTDRLIQEGEVKLDEDGKASYQVKAKSARNTKELFKTELFTIYAFKKTSDGFYDPASLQDITSKAVIGHVGVNSISLTLNGTPALKGYTAYILTQHYYNSCSNFSPQAVEILKSALENYSDIPFDGVGLDEYKGLRIAKPEVFAQRHELFRERVYSIDMKQKMKATTGLDLDRMLFDMRYAPEGTPAIRIKAVNEYMNLLRKQTQAVETAVYDIGKRLYGKETFIGLHSTFHNNLDLDEVWQTGISWWNIKRDYGQTDEETATPIQLGIGMSYPQNAMYNMYYSKNPERIWTKALYDLRFGVRTHYHAANDVQGWGVSIDAAEALPAINKVENAARLLNRFNPGFPDVKLLVVYGMEALCNWYPDSSHRGLYDMNTGLNMENKSIELWNNGYLHAAIPTDEIEDGRLKLNAEGKPVLHGYVFDAVVFIGPQYVRSSTVHFFHEYVNKGGKLLIDGTATKDFYGNPLGRDWKQTMSKAIALSYSLENVAKLGVAKNPLKNGVSNGGGVYTFTSAASLQNDAPADFSFIDHGNIYKGIYKGLVAIQVGAKGNIVRLAGTGFSSLSKNGKKIFSLSAPADVFVNARNSKPEIIIADKTKSIQVVMAN